MTCQWSLVSSLLRFQSKVSLHAFASTQFMTHKNELNIRTSHHSKAKLLYPTFSTGNYFYHILFYSQSQHRSIPPTTLNSPIPANPQQQFTIDGHVYKWMFRHKPPFFRLPHQSAIYPTLNPISNLPISHTRDHQVLKILWKFSSPSSGATLPKRFAEASREHDHGTFHLD